MDTGALLYMHLQTGGFWENYFLFAHSFLCITELARALLDMLFCTGGGIGHAAAQLVAALFHKPEGRGFDFRWFHWNFSFIKSFRLLYGPGVDSASNRNESRSICWGYRRSVLTNFMCRLSEVWEPQLPGTLEACPGITSSILTKFLKVILFSVNSQAACPAVRTE
jgi:hypothetical protein